MARNMTRSYPRSNMIPSMPFPDIGNLLRGVSLAPVLRELEQAPRMQVDIEETDQAYILRADVPGADREDITVTVDGNTVTVMANVMQQRGDEGRNMILSERVYGEEYRVFTLPQEVDESKAEARMENGVLVLTLPKKTGTGATKLNIQQQSDGGSAKVQSAGGSAQSQSASGAAQGKSASGSAQEQPASGSNKGKSS
jgi:HSP20 family protein